MPTRPSLMQTCGWRGAALALLMAGNPACAQGVAEQGFRIMTDGSLGNCLACHALPGQTGVLSSFGPALANVGTRYSPEQLRQWVSDARQLKPDTLMPPFGTTQGTYQPARVRPMLSEEEIAHVVAALQTLR